MAIEAGENHPANEIRQVFEVPEGYAYQDATTIWNHWKGGVVIRHAAWDPTGRRVK